jgi:TRAP-type C4-dicarboxylate transport system permease small subunit
MSVVSIVGRKLFSAPIPGDMELLQTCAAFASASFFGYCHLNRGDVKVDFFTSGLRRSTVGKLDAVGSMLVSLFGLLLAWRTTVGALDLREYGETTAILAIPIWAAQALMVPGFVLLALSGLFMAIKAART